MYYEAARKKVERITVYKMTHRESLAKKYLVEMNNEIVMIRINCFDKKGVENNVPSLRM